uniref:(northern house mosquito) hypothetical protein n=1 Tax=Culex pipiens TaxID=7175 RepID=A0A8D8A2Z1_CULPI
MGRFSTSRMPSRYTKLQRTVAMNEVTTTNRNQWVPPSRAGDAQAMQMMPNNSCTSFKMPGIDVKYCTLNLIQLRLLSGLAWPAGPVAVVLLGGAAWLWSTVTTVSVIMATRAVL